MLNRRTRSLFLALFFVFVNCFVFAQTRDGKGVVSKQTPENMKAGAFIDVNAAGYPESNYSITQLVKDVLISGGSTCSAANVSNVVVSPNLPISDPNRSWGYFNKATTNFPFAKGIVLTTGYARKAGNNLQGTLSDPLPTAGDADLAAALSVPNSELHDATYIEFDFVPASTKVTFRYLFASKEYQSNFPCNISDGFALLLKPVGGAYTNLAVLPGGAGPVSVTNIRPAISTSTGSCAASNASYLRDIIILR
ncbi:choice-of-anchor L domain-containing protein [Chryseobacterium arachidis]|uniref:choice-of-anchor L domain-containing protein n=1 Tax=Chryseobacterium arachidis TaxID=1416778 RepID=UPI0036168ECA